MKYIWLLVILCAGSAFGQNSYGTDFVNLHCTAPDPSAPPNFGDAPKPGLVPTSAATGNAILYCDASSSALKVSFSGSAYAAVGGGGLPTGLSFTAPTLTVSTAGSGNGAIALSGTTSGTATITAPSVAGTLSNPVVFSNILQLPNSGCGANPSLTNTTGTQSGLSLGSGNAFLCFASSNAFGFSASAFAFAAGKGQHFNTQAAQSDTSGTCTMSGGTCTAITFTTAYTSAPACTVSWTGGGTLTGILSTAATTTQIKPTSSVGTDTAVITYICVGNPN